MTREQLKHLIDKTEQQANAKLKQCIEAEQDKTMTSSAKWMMACEYHELVGRYSALVEVYLNTPGEG